MPQVIWIVLSEQRQVKKLKKNRFYYRVKFSFFAQVIPAEAQWRKRYSMIERVDGWIAVSAGLAAYPGILISPDLPEVLHEWGIDADAHRAQPIDDQLMESTDLIVTMTDAHKDILVRLYPDRVDDIVSYSAFTENQKDIDDPYGFSLTSYRATRDRIKRG